MKAAALLSEAFFHHLDHLGPLCYYLEISLLVDDSLTYRLAKHYYPQVDVQKVTFSLAKLGKQYDLFIVSTKYAAKELKQTMSAMGHPNKRFCFCPHGQSDKGLIDPEMLCFVEQDIALIYGDRQLELIKNLEPAKRPRNIVEIGNLRLQFYKEHRFFFDDIAEKEVFSKFSPDKATALYAPTWTDLEKQSSFLSMAKEVTEELSKHFNLIVKLHPFLERDHPAHVMHLLEVYQNHPSVQILFEFPLIYPLLSRVDFYLGDASSIGYDALACGKPLYFLGSSPIQSPLRQFGHVIASPKELIREQFSIDPSTLQMRQAFCCRAFAKPPSLKDLKLSLQKTLFNP